MTGLPVFLNAHVSRGETNVSIFMAVRQYVSIKARCTLRFVPNPPKDWKKEVERFLHFEYFHFEEPALRSLGKQFRETVQIYISMGRERISKPNLQSNCSK